MKLIGMDSQPVRGPVCSHYRRPALAIVLVFACLAAAYSIVNPILESPDEIAHYAYVQHLADGKGLPVQDPANLYAYAQEGSQPPLYYAMAAALIAPIDTTDGAEILVANPYVQIGVVTPSDNVNALVHTEAENWPWHGTTLAIHLTRLLSVVLSVGTVLGVLAMGRELFAEHPIIGLGGAALVAFNPMFLYISGSINNDNLITCLATWALVAMIRILFHGASWTRIASLGVLCGLAALAKVSGLALLPMAVLALGSTQWLKLGRHEPDNASGSTDIRAIRAGVGSLVKDAFVVTGLAVLVAGWWYARNLQLYGEPLGIETMLDIFGRRLDPMTLALAASEFKGFRMSYWGIFGSFMILLRPAWVYLPLEALMAAGGLGVVRWGFRRDPHQGWPRPSGKLPFWLGIALLILWSVVLHLSLVRWTLMTPASQGRLVFPAIGAISLLTIWGLCGWFRPARWPAVVAVALTVPAVLACVTPWLTIRPAYAPPPRIAPGDIPPNATPFGTTYGGQVELVAYDLSPDAVAPGESLTVTLYWRRLATVDEDYSLYLHLFGRDGEMIAYHDSLAGMGTFPTSQWSPEEIVTDTYIIQVSPSARAPVAARLNVGLGSYDTMERLPVTDGLGREVLQPTLGLVKVQGPGQEPKPEHRLDYEIGDGVRLVGYSLDETRLRPGAAVPLTLYWQTAPLDRDYTVFVHLVTPDGHLAGQGDGPPMGGEYPTRYWGQGEWIEDEHLLQLRPDAEPGEMLLAVGLYDDQGQRLPVSADGASIGDSARIGTVTVLQP